MLLLQSNITSARFKAARLLTLVLQLLRRLIPTWLCCREMQVFVGSFERQAQTEVQGLGPTQLTEKSEGYAAHIRFKN